MSDINEAIRALRALCADVQHTQSTVLEAVASIDRTTTALSGLDDPHARNAVADLRVARSELRDAHATWINEFLKRANELCERLSA